MQAAGNSEAAESVTAYCLALLRKELGSTPANASVERLRCAAGLQGAWRAPPLPPPLPRDYLHCSLLRPS